MPLSKEHKARTREKIIDSAANLFRKHGSDGVTIERIMKGAGLTHGGFYAHFQSKSELFVEVVKSRHDLIRRLEARDGNNRNMLNLQGREIFDKYLSDELQPLVSPNCTLSTLNVEAARASDEARSAFTEAVKNLLQQIERSSSVETRSTASSNIASLAIGAMALARVSADEDLTKDILAAARDQVDEWFKSMS